MPPARIMSVRWNCARRSVTGAAEAGRCWGLLRCFEPKDDTGKRWNPISRRERFHEPVEIAHACLGLAASKRLLDESPETEYAIAWRHYHERSMDYCMVHVLIDQSLWAVREGILGEAERLSHKHGYVTELAMIKRIRTEGAWCLHPLNFP